MYAVVLWRPHLDLHSIESVMLAETRDAALDRAVSLAADLNLFDRWDDAEADRVKRDLDADPSYGDDKTRIAVVRAFRA